MESSPSSQDNLDAPDSLKLFKLLVAGAGRLGPQEISFGFLVVKHGFRNSWEENTVCPVIREFFERASLTVKLGGVVIVEINIPRKEILSVYTGEI